MGKNVMLSDKAYNALSKVKRGSFSDTILWLLEERKATAGRLVELFEQQNQLIEQQNRLLTQLVEQLRRLNARLIELKARIRLASYKTILGWKSCRGGRAEWGRL